MQLFGKESWFAVQVTPRHEKKVDAILGLMLYEHFLPTHRAKRHWSDRVKTIEEPLFPGYLFVRIRPALVRSVLMLPGVIRIVNFGGVPCPVPEEDITALRLVCHSKRDACAVPYLGPGKKVQVIAGPLCGVTGIVADWKKHDRLIIDVDLIMNAVSVEIDSSEIAPLNPDLAA